MTMSMPGQVRQTVNAPATARKLGLIQMAVGSNHMITITPKGGRPRSAQVQVRDRRLHPKAKAVLICLSPLCRGKTWESEAEMREAHPDPFTMEKAQEVHVFGAWSEEPCNPPDPTCKRCDVAKAVVCPEHSGGVLGLLSSAAHLG